MEAPVSKIFNDIEEIRDKEQIGCYNQIIIVKVNTPKERETLERFAQRFYDNTDTKAKDRGVREHITAFRFNKYDKTSDGSPWVRLDNSLLHLVDGCCIDNNKDKVIFESVIEFQSYLFLSGHVKAFDCMED